MESLMIGITKEGQLIEINAQGVTGMSFLGFIICSQSDLSEEHQIKGCHLSAPDSSELRELILLVLHKYQNHDLLKSE